MVNMKVSLKTGFVVLRFILDCRYRFSSGNKYSLINGSQLEFDDSDRLERCCLPCKLRIRSTITISFSDWGSYSKLNQIRPILLGGRSSYISIS